MFQIVPTILAKVRRVYVKMMWKLFCLQLVVIFVVQNKYEIIQYDETEDSPSHLEDAPTWKIIFLPP